MNISSESEDPYHGEDQAQGCVPDSNKKDNNLDNWIDNFLVETGDLEEKDGRESSETKLTSGEDVSAWADRILSGGSSGEEKGDGSLGHHTHGECDDVGNTSIPSPPHQGSRSATSTIIGSNDGDNDDQANKDESESGDPGNAQSSNSAIFATMNSDDDDDDSDDGETRIPAPYLPFHNEGDDYGVGTVNDKADGESGSVRNPYDDPVSTPSSFNGKTTSLTSISISSDEDGDCNNGFGTEEETLESTPILAFDNEDDSSDTGSGESHNNGDSRNELGPGTSSPLNHKKSSSTLITIISDDNDEQVLSHEPERESLEPIPAVPEKNENDSPGNEIAGTDGESNNTGDAQNEHGKGTNPLPRNRRKKSLSSIAIISDDDDQAGEHNPAKESPKFTPADTRDNEDDYSGVGITRNISDWDEIDLNSENEDHEESTGISTEGVGSGGMGTNRSIQGSTDPILPGGSENGSLGYDQTYASYYKMYFNFLYLLRVSPYKGDGRNPLGILNFILFAVVVLVASLHSAMSIKNVVFYKEEDDILLHFIKIGYDLNILLYRLYIVYLETFRSSALRNIINAADEFGGQVSKLELALSIGSTLLMSILLGFIFPFADIIASIPGAWDFEDVTLASSGDFAETLLAWNRERFGNDSEYIWDTYGTDITNIVILMSVSYFAFAIIGFVHLFLMKDYAIVSALTMYRLCKQHSRDIDHLSSSPPTPETCERLWKQYKLLRAFSDQLNDSHGFLFQLFHLDNVLFSAYLLFLQFTSGGSFLLALLQFCLLAKLIIFYLLAANAALVNEKLDNWVQTTFTGQNTSIVENGELMTTSNLLHQLDKHPIGIGRGMFFIDGTFLWKFMSVVGSILIFFIDKRQ